MTRADPQLSRAEREKAEAHSAPRALVIHEIVRQEGEESLARAAAALAVSGFAAGLSMGFSFLVMALLRGHLPDAPWRAIAAAPGYAVGFLIVILGRQQLFTESTLTAILPVLTRPSAACLAGAARVWAVVLLANLAGTWLFAWMLSHEGVFAPAIWEALRGIAAEARAAPAGVALMKAVMAGWLIALMVWLLPGAGSARILIILILTTVVALGTMPHIVAGSVEAAWAVLIGEVGPGHYLTGFLLPALLGNAAGGVALTALLNHAPLAADLRQDPEG